MFRSAAGALDAAPLLTKYGSKVLSQPGLRARPSPSPHSSAPLRPFSSTFRASTAPPRARFHSGGQSGSHQHGRQQHHSSSSRAGRTRIEYLILPVALSTTSPLLLEADPHGQQLSFKTIAESVPKPRPSEFHTTKAQEDAERRKGHLFWRVVWFVRDYVIEPISTTVRFVHLALLFLPVIAASPILLLETLPEGVGRRPRRLRRTAREEERSSTRWWYSLLVAQMRRAGPTFIKLAQWAGSRTDLFPAALCDLFGELHSNGRPHSLHYTKRVLERAFSRPFDEIFLEFKQKPMGVGAIAQVYKAVINPDLLPSEYLGPKHIDDPSPVARVGRVVAPLPEDQKPERKPSAAVAIKVLHPGVEKTIKRDLKIMMFFARALNAFPGMEWLSFPEEVQSFGEMMLSQVDLRIEANNLVTFEDKFMHRPTVSFPRALKSYTSSQVLVEEFEDAVPLEAFLREGGGAYDHRIANLGLDAFLSMLLIDNFCHADLHPGNIMIKFFKPTTQSLLNSLWATWFDKPEPDAAAAPTNTEGVEIVHHLRSLQHDREAWLKELDRLDDEGYQPEIVFIDTGLVTTLSPQNRKNFLDLFSAIAHFDGHKAGKLMVERCRTPELVIDEETFALKIQHLVLGVKSQTFSLAKVKVADVLSQVLLNVRQHHVKLEAEFVNTILSILLLEGIGRQLDPNLDLFKSSIPILRQVGKQVGTTELMSQASEHLDTQSLLDMLKIWIYVEARSLADIGVNQVDDFLRYDYLTFNG